MTNYSEQFLELQVQIAEKEHIETKLLNLRDQRDSLESTVGKLKWEKSIEDADVEKLKGGSLLRFLLQATGSYDKKLDKEQQEALEKYVDAIYDMESLFIKKAFFKGCEFTLSFLTGAGRLGK